MRVAAVVPSLMTESDTPVIIRSLWGDTCLMIEGESNTERNDEWATHGSG